MSDTLHPCAACGCLVHRARCGSGVACPVCGWVDDFEQLVHPDITYGANAGLSLRQAQARSREVAERASSFPRDPRWRPLRPGENPAADPNGPTSPVCYIATPDPADFVPYWLRGRAG